MTEHIASTIASLLNEEIVLLNSNASLDATVNETTTAASEASAMLNLILNATVSTTVNVTVNAATVVTSVATVQVSHGFSTASICILMFLCILAITENVFTCYLIFTNKILHTATNTFVFSLCTTDMLCAGVLIPIAVFYKGSIAYQYLAAISVFTYASNLTAVTYERLISITKPLRYRSIITRRIALRITIAAWAIPVIYCLVPLAWETNLFSLEHKIFVIIALLIFLVFPLFFICFVYIRILVEVHRLLKEGRHLVVYSFEAENQTAPDSLFKRLRDWSLEACRLRCQTRKGGAQGIKHETSQRMNDDSNEDSSCTCKTDPYASSLAQESPCIPRCHKNQKFAVSSATQKCEREKSCSDNHLQIDGKSRSPNIGIMKLRTQSEHADDDVNMHNDDVELKVLKECNQAPVIPQANSKHLEINAVAKGNANAASIAKEEDSLEEHHVVQNTADGANVVLSTTATTGTTADEEMPLTDEQGPFLQQVNDAKDGSEICNDDVTEGENNAEIQMIRNNATLKEETDEACYGCLTKKAKQNVNKECSKPKSGRRRRSFRRRQMFDEIKASTAFAGVAFTYMFTWIPVIYMTTMDAISKSHMIPQTIDKVNIWTIAINAAIDPLFYALILRNFRKVIKKNFKKARNRHKI